MGLTEEAARDAAEAGGYGAQVAVVKSSFKANSKALAEKEGEGMAKMIYRCAPKHVSIAQAHSIVNLLCSLSSWQCLIGLPFYHDTVVASLIAREGLLPMTAVEPSSFSALCVGRILGRSWVCTSSVCTPQTSSTRHQMQ